MEEKLFTSVIEEALHADQTGELVNEINQRLQTISVQLENDFRQLNTQQMHSQIMTAQQAVASAQKLIQLFKSIQNLVKG